MSRRKPFSDYFTKDELAFFLHCISEANLPMNPMTSMKEMTDNDFCKLLDVVSKKKSEHSWSCICLMSERYDRIQKLRRKK